MKDEPIIKPNPFKGFECKKVFFIPYIPRFLPFLSALKKLTLEEKKTEFGSLLLFKNKTILLHCMSSPLAVISLEKLILSGVKEIIILGFCGSINPKFEISDVVCISRALSEEGTSRHYFYNKKLFNASTLLREKIESYLHESNLPFHNGIIVSTDAPYRETLSWVARMQEKGVDLVDMESSAVFALAKFYGIQAASLMIVSDELFTKVWKTGFHYPELYEKINEYFIPFLKK